MKILVILLVIGILLFVVLMVWGAGRNAGPSPKGDTTSQAKGFDPDSGQHSTLDAFNSLLAPFSPTLEAGSMTPALTVFDLALKPSFTVIISSDSKHDFRQAKFMVQPEKTCAHIKYQASDSSADTNLRVQDSKDDTGSKKYPNELKLTILKGGGTLIIERTQPLNAGACKVELK